MEEDILGNDYGDLSLLGEEEFPYFFSVEDITCLHTNLVEQVIKRTNRDVSTRKKQIDKYYYELVKKYAMCAVLDLDYWLYHFWVQPPN